jgi:hypothetical protein
MSQKIYDIVTYPLLNPITINATPVQIAEYEAINTNVVIEQYVNEKNKKIIEHYIFQYANSDEAITCSKDLVKKLEDLKVDVVDIPTIITTISPNNKDKDYKLPGAWRFWTLGIMLISLFASYGVSSEVFFAAPKEILTSGNTYTSSLSNVTNVNYGDKVNSQGEYVYNTFEEYTYTTGRKFKTTHKAYNFFALCRIQGTPNTFIVHDSLNNIPDLDKNKVLDIKIVSELYCNSQGIITNLKMNTNSFTIPGIEVADKSVKFQTNQEAIDDKVKALKLNKSLFMVENTSKLVSKSDILTRSILVVAGNLLIAIATISEFIKYIKFKRKVKSVIQKSK